MGENFQRWCKRINRSYPYTALMRCFYFFLYAGYRNRFILVGEFNDFFENGITDVTDKNAE